MVIFFYLLCLFVGLFAYKTRRYVCYVLASFLIISNGAGILPDPLPFKVNDVFLLLCFGTWLMGYRRYPIDKSGRYIKYLLIYYILSVIGTILLGIETPIYALMVLRLEIYLLAYFLYRSLPYSCIEKSFRGIFYISLISGFLYYLQFLGITGILQRGSEVTMGMMSRLNNIPICTDIIIFYLAYTEKRIRCKWFYLLFFIGMVLLSQNRGQWLSVGFCISMILIYKKQVKKIIFGMLFLTFIIYLFLPIISYRFSDGGKSSTDLMAEIQSSYNVLVHGGSQYYIQGASVIFTEGTSMFRALLIRERLDYLFINPFCIFLGIGSIHEMSPAGVSLPFMMGNEWDNGNIKKIDTNDVAFLSHFIRYGLVFIVLYGKFLISSMKQLMNNHNSELYFCCFMLLLDSLIQMFNGDRFTGINMMFVPLLLISQSSKQN